jgi:hypothetical protein
MATQLTGSDTGSICCVASPAWLLRQQRTDDLLKARPSLSDTQLQPTPATLLEIAAAAACGGEFVLGVST